MVTGRSVFGRFGRNMCNVQGVRLTAGTRPALACFRFAATTSGSHRSASHAGGCRIGTEGEQHQRDTGTARRGEGVCLGVMREIRGTPTPSGIQNQLLAGTVRPEVTAQKLLALLPSTRSGSLGKHGKRACLQRTRHDAAQRVGRPKSVEHLQGSRQSTSHRVRQATAPGTRNEQPGSGQAPTRVVAKAQASPSGWRVPPYLDVGCAVTVAQAPTATHRWLTRHHPAEAVGRPESVMHLHGSRPSASRQFQQTTLFRTRDEESGSGMGPARVAYRATVSPNGRPIAPCPTGVCGRTGLQQATATPRWRTRHHAAERVSRPESVDYLQGTRQGASPGDRQPAVDLNPGVKLPAASKSREAL